MKAFKGFRKDLTCLGFQFRENGINRTEEANCVQNGFHCAENPLDCFHYYPDWRNSVYYEVDAAGDLDEDAVDSKISCTEMRLVRRLSLEQMLFEAAVYILEPECGAMRRKRENFQYACYEAADGKVESNLKTAS